MRHLVLAGIAAVFLACSSNDSSGPSQSVAGTYHVVSVGGQNVPTVIYSDATSQITFVSGTATLNANHTWSSTFTVHFNAGGVQSDQTFPGNGTWTQNGNTLTLVDASDNSTFTATVSGNTITGQIDFDQPVGVKTIVFSK